jgi:hypothetical protein
MFHKILEFIDWFLDAFTKSKDDGVINVGGTRLLATLQIGLVHPWKVDPTRVIIGSSQWKQNNLWEEFSIV